MRDAHARQPFGFGKVEEALHLAVEPVAHLLQHDIRIGILARVLADGGDACEDFIHVRQVEVTAQGKVLGTPVVPPEKRMHVREARLPRGGVTQMPHIHLSRKGEHALGIAGIVQLFFRKVFKVALHRAEYLGDGSRTERPFAKHIFLAGVRFQFHTSQSGAFLPPVVLFLHEKIELVQPVHPCTVLFFVILQRFQQAYHGDATFMLQLFHTIFIVCSPHRRDTFRISGT